MKRPPFLSPAYPALAHLSVGYSEHRGRLLTRYSPVRHSTRFPKETFAFDLHVLSTPPAFVLSQNQTLQFNIWTVYDSFVYVFSIAEGIRALFSKLRKLAPMCFRKTRWARLLVVIQFSRIVFIPLTQIKRGRPDVATKIDNLIEFHNLVKIYLRQFSSSVKQNMSPYPANQRPSQPTWSTCTCQ